MIAVEVLAFPNEYGEGSFSKVAGLPIVAVGIILLACRLLDGVSDLVMGAVVERTCTREGKARPWVKRMAIPFLCLLFPQRMWMRGRNLSPQGIRVRASH